MTETRWTVPIEDAGVRLDKFLAGAARLGSRGRATVAIDRGKIFVNDAEVGHADAARPLEPGDQVRMWADRPGSATRRGSRPSTGPDGLQIVYEDDVMIVVNKPAGLLSVPLPRQSEAPSVQDLLVLRLRSHGKRKPLVVHRIDRDTSGLVAFATRADAQQRLKDQFRRREAERVYLAVVYGHPSPREGTWRDHLAWDQRALIQKETHPRDPRATEARSAYRVLEEYTEASLIEVTLVTGKRNQIRLQARLRGHMLVGEQRYVYGPEDLRSIPFRRQALHAHRLRLCHPVTGDELRFEVPMPEDMTKLVAALRRHR
jgi:23S rRNA pseudouridine1911/1915/1917 synthase